MVEQTVQEQLKTKKLRIYDTERRQYYLESKVNLLLEITERKYRDLERRQRSALERPLKQKEKKLRNPLLDNKDQKHSQYHKRLQGAPMSL